MSLLNFLKVFQKSDIGDNVLVLDIESDSVKAVIINTDLSKKRFQITALNKEWRESQFSANNIIDSNDLQVNIKKIVSNILRKNKSIAFKKIIIISGKEILESASFNLEFPREDPTKKIEMSEIKDILQKSFEKIRSEIIKGKTGEETIPDDEFRIVGGMVQDVLVDGYPVASPLGFQGKKISLNIFCSFLPTNFFELFGDLARSLNIESWELKHRTGLLAEYFLEKIKKENAILINIGSHFTESILIRNRHIKNINSFAIGGSSFTKLLADQMGIGFNEAENLKLKYSQGKTRKSISEKIKGLIAKETELFERQMHISIKELLGNELMPETLYLSGGGAMLPELQDLFKKGDGVILRDLPSLAQTEIVLLSIENDESFLKSNLPINTVADASMIISGFALANAIERNGLNSLFKSLIK